VSLKNWKGRIYVSPSESPSATQERAKKNSNFSNYLSSLGKKRGKGTKGSLHSICSLNRHPTPRAIYQNY
jgi:hypothetical protein